MMALSSVKTGKTGIISCLKTEDEALMRKLMALGIMPGINIQLEQKFPSYIIKIGRTRATLDQETAERIYIQ
ncbi:MULTISPECIES: FeoA family protein [Planktothrix]|uniref:Ferrous iron transport protein A n=1 Tax=Planktothrix mougeotii LEGE 06226 TaxID=1828728 RepID=A0ABR9UB27_9CYAN|nr:MULTISPECIES: FeoA family protein [Planktothrix]MBD2480644.1 ferrous iron transport protein A [Planktothrix sp. FACHB-1365]MBE9143645.1 ferrous iron transport protein A [Planktothrix mougeotii LEGE 06226]